MTDDRGDPDPGAARRPGRLGRIIWVPVGLGCVGLGALGLVLPGLPATIFFIAAAAAFARSSPRLEAWLLGLPAVGPLVRDHRAGLGMPVRAKAIAVTMIAGAVTFSALRTGSTGLRVALVTAGLVGIIVVLRQPTKRDVRAGTDGT